jgi:MoaA/NifB/PqqE/SkfB family radical SAM enzyme
MQENYGYDLEFPYMLQGKDKLTLHITDKGLQGSRRHFMRMDLYPMIAPSHPKRHYGWWDIPLQEIGSGNTDIELNIDAGLVRFRGRSGKEIEIKSGFTSDLRERGYLMLHLSLWKTRASLFDSRPAMIATKAYPMVLTTADGDVSLNQVTLPVTDRCNLSCKMCPRHAAPGLIEEDMSDEIFQAVLEIAPKIIQVCTQCLGEPLLNKNIFQIIRRLKERMPEEGQVGCSTNGTLLNEGNAVALLDSGIDFLIFSLDGAERETVESIRVGAKFDTIIQSINNCVKYRKTKGSQKPRIEANFVMMEDNIRQIPRYIAMCADLGIDSVLLSYSCDSRTGKFLIFSSATIEPLLDKAREIAARKGLGLVLPRLARNKVERCYNMQHARVLISGEVRPCCPMLPGFDLQRKIISFGNVKERPLIDIWYDPEYVDFRRKVIKGEFTDACVDCDYKTGLVF